MGSKGKLRNVASIKVQTYSSTRLGYYSIDAIARNLCKMKVLLLGSHMNYNLEHYVYMNLERLGHDVKFCGYKQKLGRLANIIRITITRSKFIRNAMNIFWINEANEEIKMLAEKFQPDLVISIKGEVVKPETIEWIKEELNAKTVLWYPDDPRFFNSLVKYIAPAYDHIFSASERIIPAYRELGCKNVHFLPFACEPKVHRKMNLDEKDKRKYETDVVFVGTYTPRRAKFVKALEKAGIKVKVYGPYWKYFKHGDNVGDGIYGREMVNAFNATKIVLNIHIEDDLPYKVNMKTFEATGSGAFLLTDKPYGLENLFLPIREVVCYNDEKELIELTNYYLSCERERMEISTEGLKRTHKEHTYKKRVENLLKTI